ncbi:hypothetical protein EV641_1274 [Rhodococcus sp. SMB37]|uniref:hypothetical protein n=1 Tax=Rhodococcus sp. SMB37 TaxID=2512213 RepID=UPI0006D0FBA3|nr:hypothetical protein [Rhodococcus sp. SMB37]TCN43363.1 hypothetical protein EV641_1274 [Rhodococcus sp. SMB37]
MITREIYNDPTSVDTQSRTHEHGWAVESSHSTSMGRVLYVLCDACGARRVDLQHHTQVPPAALSKDLI